MRFQCEMSTEKETGKEQLLFATRLFFIKKTTKKQTRINYEKENFMQMKNTFSRSQEFSLNHMQKQKQKKRLETAQLAEGCWQGYCW